MISTVVIRNFKSCRDVRLDLERFTIFVGPNASGKSSILQALNCLCRAFRLEGGFDEDELLQNISRSADDELEFICQLDQYWYRYRTHIASKERVGRSASSNQWSGGGLGTTMDLNSGDWEQWRPNHDDAPPLPRSVLLRLETSKLVEATSDSDAGIMAPDGSGLHFASANMALNEPELWQKLQFDLQQIVPTIHRLRHTKTSQYEPPAVLFDTIGALSLTADQVSEGTLHVLGLLTALHSADDRAVLLLDDLDRGLHPKAQKELISFLRKLLETKPDLQLLATTHSPYMLDSMEASEVRMTYLRDDGTTVCGALAEHPEFEKWKDEMTPGEMWSLFGEKWMADAPHGKVELISRDAD